jgi:type-F conjugative transfer system pilin assembly thiol-disulfide isomerase TrbB
MNSKTILLLLLLLSGNTQADRILIEQTPPPKSQIKNNSELRNYEFVLFYRTNCPHCISFEPILKLYSDNSHIPVRAFALSNKASTAFPNSIAVSQELVDQYFGKGANVAVPTLFILNKNNLHAYPVSRGSLTYLELTNRMNQLVPKILSVERNTQ